MKLGVTAGCRRLRHVLCRRWHGCGLILLYHRVARATADPFGLCVDPANFAEQMEILARHAMVVPLACISDAICRPRAALVAAITFDDGYADNLHEARPVLERFDLPATVFVATGCLGRGRLFWSDELRLLLLDHALLPGAALHLDLAGAAFVWRPELDGSLAKLHEALWERLRPLPDSVQQETLAALAAWIGMARPREEACRPLEPEEVLALAAGGLIEIGAHTRTHPLLPAHAPEFQEEEIASSKAEAEALAGRPVTSFAYPYGGYTPETVRLVAASGFARACASIHALVWPDSDRFLLPRIVVGDWDGALFQQRLQEEFLW